MLIPCEPLPLFLLLSRIHGLDHSEINTSFYKGCAEPRSMGLRRGGKGSGAGLGGLGRDEKGAVGLGVLKGIFKVI